MSDVDAGPATDELSVRASTGRRLLAIAFGIAAIVFGATAPYLAPDRCLWAGWVALALFVPVGCIVIILGVRGRATELRDLSATAFVEKLIGAAIVAVVCGLLSLVFFAGPERTGGADPPPRKSVTRVRVV